MKSAGKHFLIFGLILLLAVDLTGCGPQWKRKFIRKGKEVSPPQPILVLESDEKAVLPPAARYQEHYAYWKSWHSELLSSYGQIHKRDLRYLSGAIGELRAMREILSDGPAAARLQEILTQLNQMETSWQSAPEGVWQPSVRDRSQLQKFQRLIEKDFTYSHVKESVPAKN